MIQQLQPEKIKVNGKVITISCGAVVNLYDLTEQEKEELRKYIHNNYVDIVTERVRIEAKLIKQC